MTSTAPTVTGLNVFPIKSCQAVVVQELTVDSYGVVDDRRLMVVDTNGRFISQRRCPVLATVTAYYKEEGDKRFMVVSSPTVSEELVFEPLTTGPRLTCSVWESSLELVDQGNAAAEWFSNLIGQCGCYRLVGCGSNEGYTRLVDNLPPSLKHRLPAMSLSLADSGPVSLISQESLDDLNTRMKSSYGTQVAFDRFRMNIEVSGCRESFEEDHWLLVKVGTVPFLVYTSAERCKMTGIDQTSGLVDKVGPLEILRIFRAPQGPTHAMFGQLLIPLQPGTVRLGDHITVLELKKSSPI